MYISISCFNTMKLIGKTVREEKENLVKGQIIQDKNKPKLWFLLIIYCPIFIHIPKKFH